MDAAIAPDSSVTHLAAAFGVSAISIYGPFPSLLRTRDYPLNSSIDAAAECAPCFTHGHWPCREARKAGVINSPCFDRIPQAAINDAIETLAARICIHSPAKRFREYAARQPTASSETSKFKGPIVEALSWALGADPAMLNGVEVGTGGAPLIDNLVSVDLPIPYTKCGMAPIQIKGDGKMLSWFSDGSLDYLYSSHLFEDFGPDENSTVLDEWLRVLRPGGVLALLLPEQTRYLRACARKGEAPNEHHVIPTFGPEYMTGLLRAQSGCRVLQTTCFWESDPEEYNFLLLVQKNASRVSAGKLT
jgi:SAM-dependent methyltransferase